jgi:hypothetical protein
MSYPPSRGMNNALSEGSTDGKYKKIVSDRDGVVDPATYENRADLNNQWFGITEKPVKVAPDGLFHRTPNYVSNPVIPGQDAY